MISPDREFLRTSLIILDKYLTEDRFPVDQVLSVRSATAADQEDGFSVEPQLLM